MAEIRPLAPIGNGRQLCARAQARQHSVQRLPHLDHRRARPRRLYRGLRSGDHRLAAGAGQGAAASDRLRHPLARRRPDLHAVPRRLRVLGGIRPLEPQDGHADRGDRDHVFHPADPAGAKRRAIDHPAPVDRAWRRRCGLGGVPDRRRIDAGAAPAHLRRDLRDGAGDLLHRGAVHRLPARRQPQRLSASGTAGRAGDHRRAGAGLFRDSRKPALAFAQRPAAGRGRHRQPDHQAVRQPRAAADGRGARRPLWKPPARSCRPIGHCSRRASCAGPRSAFWRRLRRHRLFPDFRPAAKGAGRSGCGRQL